MKSLAIFATITLLGIAALPLFIERDTPRVASHASEPAPIPASQAAPAQVIPRSTARLPDLPNDQRPDDQRPDEERVPSKRTAEAEIAERRVQLQTRFDGQSVDPSWAMQSRQLLRDDLGKYANADVRVRDVECRSSMCRIALASSNRTAQQSVVEDWIRHRTWTGSGFAVEDGDATIVYVSKPGVDLLN